MQVWTKSGHTNCTAEAAGGGALRAGFAVSWQEPENDGAKGRQSGRADGFPPVIKLFWKGGGQIMHVSPFISGIATGAVAGAVVSMVAAGAMMNPSVRRSAQHAANKAEHAMHKAAHNVGHMIG